MILFLLEYQKKIQRRLESQKVLKKIEKIKSTWRILYYLQNSRKEFEVSTSRKEDEGKKPKKIGFYWSSQKEEEKKKERKKPKNMCLLHKFIS